MYVHLVTRPDPKNDGQKCFYSIRTQPVFNDNEHVAGPFDGASDAEAWVRSQGRMVGQPFNC